MRAIQGVLTVSMLMAAIVLCGGCKQTEEDKDRAEIVAMTEAYEAKMRADIAAGNFGRLDGPLAYKLLIREQGMIGTGRSRPQPAKLREFKRIITPTDYANALAYYLTPAQLARLHELRVKYDYVQYVEDVP